MLTFQAHVFCWHSYWLPCSFNVVVLLLQTVQQRGAAVIKARKLSSAMSAAKAICDHMRDIWTGTAEVNTIFICNVEMPACCKQPRKDCTCMSLFLWYDEVEMEKQGERQNLLCNTIFLIVSFTECVIFNLLQSFLNKVQIKGTHGCINHVWMYISEEF